MFKKQKTLKKEIIFEGIGVHTGKPGSVRLVPAAENTGVVLTSKNVPGDEFVLGTIVPEVAMHATVIKRPAWAISTIEHLMAALWMLEVDNVRVEFDCYETPILDGSALPFVQGVLSVGLQEQNALKKYLTPKTEIEFADEKGRIIKIMPAKQNENGAYDYSLHLDYMLDFAHPLVGATTMQATITTAFFVKEIAPARTFGFLEQLPLLRQHGLAQGTNLGNTLVIGPDEILNEPRFKDECVRHKVLDLLGDMSLLGKNLAGTVIARKTGHSFNRLVVEHYVKNPDSWMLI